LPPRAAATGESPQKHSIQPDERRGSDRCLTAPERVSATPRRASSTRLGATPSTSTSSRVRPDVALGHIRRVSSRRCAKGSIGALRGEHFDAAQLAPPSQSSRGVRPETRTRCSTAETRGLRRGLWCGVRVAYAVFRAAVPAVAPQYRRGPGPGLPRRSRLPTSRALTPTSFATAVVDALETLERMARERACRMAKAWPRWMLGEPAAPRPSCRPTRPEHLERQRRSAHNAASTRDPRDDLRDDLA